jgi:Rap1a immunity proteins
MRKMLCGLFLGLLAAPLWGQTQSKNSRPVFDTAREIATDCKIYLKIFPGGRPLPNNMEVTVSTEQAAQVSRCIGYVDGTQDAALDSTFGDAYHPVSARTEKRGTLITTFVKYVEDHPEQHDLAASTLLMKAAKVQGTSR